MKKNVYVVFHNLHNAWFHKTISYMRNTTVNHCGIMIELSDKTLLYYHVGPNLGCKVGLAERYFERYVPLTTFLIGETDVSIKHLTSYAEDYPNTIPWKLILWELFKIRFWKPHCCGTFTSTYLRLAGFDVTIQVAPDALLKELKNADHYVERQGESWKDLVGKGDS